MTVEFLYTERMNTLLSVFGAGFVSLIGLFALCFFLVHTARLARIGWESQKKPPQGKPEEEKPAPVEEKPQEPIYYIVEKKRRVKTGYSEPKQIRFK